MKDNTFINNSLEVISLKVGTHEGTGPIVWTGLSKSSRREQLWSLRLVPRIQTPIFGTSPCDLFLKTLCVNCWWDKSLRPISSCKLFRVLVAGSSPGLSCLPSVRVTLRLIICRLTVSCCIITYIKPILCFRCCLQRIIESSWGGSDCQVVPWSGKDTAPGVCWHYHTISSTEKRDSEKAYVWVSIIFVVRHMCESKKLVPFVFFLLI